MTAVVGADAREHQRFGLVDTYRGVAILAVLIFHFAVCFQRPPGPEDLYGYSYHYPDWLEAGRYGVHLFFVISGLVITMTLLRSRGPLDFARKRLARIYPAFVVAVLATSAWLWLTGFSQPRVNLGEVLANLTLLAPHLGSRWVDPAYWSLLVEAKFYLVVCICYAALEQRFWAGACAYALAAAAVAHFHAWSAHHLLIADEMPFFLVGVGGWLAVFEGRRAAGLCCCGLGLGLYVYYNAAFGAGCTLTKLCMHASPNWISHAFVATSVGSMLGLLALGLRDGFAPLAWLGRISYSVYLIHQMFGLVLIRWLKASGAADAVAMGAAFAIAIGMGAMMFACVEQPGQRLLLALLGGKRRRREGPRPLGQPLPPRRLRGGSPARGSRAPTEPETSPGTS